VLEAQIINLTDNKPLQGYKVRFFKRHTFQRLNLAAEDISNSNFLGEISTDANGIASLLVRRLKKDDQFTLSAFDRSTPNADSIQIAFLNHGDFSASANMPFLHPISFNVFSTVRVQAFLHFVSTIPAQRIVVCSAEKNEIVLAMFPNSSSKDIVFGRKFLPVIQGNKLTLKIFISYYNYTEVNYIDTLEVNPFTKLDYHLDI